jgi:hypothetical protein
MSKIPPEVTGIGDADLLEKEFEKHWTNITTPEFACSYSASCPSVHISEDGMELEITGTLSALNGIEMATKHPGNEATIRISTDLVRSALELCQANTSTSGEASSAPEEPLQSGPEYSAITDQLASALMWHQQFFEGIQEALAHDGTMDADDFAHIAQEARLVTIVDPSNWWADNDIAKYALKAYSSLNQKSPIEERSDDAALQAESQPDT